jgi:hypothetical protein
MTPGLGRRRTFRRIQELSIGEAAEWTFRRIQELSLGEAAE